VSRRRTADIPRSLPAAARGNQAAAEPGISYNSWDAPDLTGRAMTADEFSDIFITQDAGEARLVLELLKSGGIDAVLFDAFASGSVAGFGPAIPARIAVPEGQKEAALEMLAAMRGTPGTEKEEQTGGEPSR